MKFYINNNIVEVIQNNYPNICIKINNKLRRLKVSKITKYSIEFSIKNKSAKLFWYRDDLHFFQVVYKGYSFLFEVDYQISLKLRKNYYTEHTIFEIKAPVSGLISKIFISKDFKVTKGQKLFSLNAMKMENEIYSPTDGKIVDVKVTESKEVNKNDILAVIQKFPMENF